jgi:WD40 repeat protein
MGSDDLNTTLVSTENVGELAPVRIENAHEGDVYSFAISPNSRMVATCSWDSTIRLWDLNDNKIQTFLSNPESPILNPPYTARSRPLIHFGRVWAGEFSHDGRYFISASSDGTARVWNVAQANGVQLTHNDVVNAVRISPDSSLIATASDDLTVKLWNRIGESISIPLQHTAAVSNVEWSPNGRMLAAGTSDGEVVLWNAQGNRLADLNAESSGAIIAIRFSPDSKLLATANFEGKNVADYDILVSIWDTQAMQQVGTSFSKHVGSPDHARAMSFSPDGTKFACADNNKFSLWNTDGFEKTVESEAGPNQINALLFLGNDKLVVSDWSGLTRIWDISQGLKAEHKLEHKKGVAFTSVCAPSLIVTGSEDGSLRFWDAKSGTLNGKPLKQTDTPFWTDVSQDGRIVASMAKGGPASSLWQVSTSLPFYYWSDPQIVYAHGADLSDDGKLLAIPVNTDAAILINVSADNLSVEEIRLRSILATCAELSEDDKVVPLDWNNWQGVRKQLEELTKSSATTEVISEPEWHKSQIAEHTHAKDYSAAIWHADRLVQFDLKNGANWLTRGKLHQLNEENDAAILDLSEADKLGEKEAGLLLATSYMKLGRFNEAQPIALAAAKSQGNEDIGRLLVSLSALDVTPYSNQELLQQAENLLGKKAYDLELSASQKLQTLARECLLKEAVAMQLKSVKDTDAEVLKRAGELVYSVYPAAKYGDPLEAFQRAAKIVLDPHLSDEEYRLAEVWSRVTFEHSTAPLEKIAALITQGTASFRYKNFEQAKVLLVKAYNDANSLSGQRPELKSELTPMFANIFSVLTMVESQVGNNEWAPKYVGNIEEYIVGMQPSVQGSEAAKQLYGEATAVFLKTFGQREVFNSKNFKPGDKLWNLQFAVWLLTASDTEHAEALTLARAAFAANAAIAPSSPLGAVTDLFDGISPPRFDWLSGWILAQSGQFDEALRELTPVAAHIGVEFQDMLFYATALDGADRKPEALGAAKQARELLTSAWGDDTKLQALPIVERLCLTKLSERLQQLTEELEQEIKSAKQESEPEAEPVPEVEKVAEPVTAAQLKPEQKPASEPQPTSEPALSPEE